MRGYTRRHCLPRGKKFSHWPWLPMASPGLGEIAEDVFGSFKDHESEVAVVDLVGIRVGTTIRASVHFRRWPRT